MRSRCLSTTARSARMSASQLAAAPDLARSLARLVLERGGPRDLAAIRDGLAAARDLARRLAALETPDEIAEAASALAAPDDAIIAALSAALADDLPYLKRDGGFVRAGYDSALDETRALRDEIAPRGGGAAGALRGRDRHPRAQGAPQQRAGLFRRGHRAARREAARGAAQRDLHPSPDAGRPGALHHHRACRAGGQDRERGRPCARDGAGDFRAACRAGDRRRRADQARGAGARRARRVGRARRAGGRARLRAPRGRRLARFRHRGRAPSGGRAGAAAGRRAVRGERLRSFSPGRARAPGASTSSPGRTWPANRPSCARTR